MTKDTREQAQTQDDVLALDELASWLKVPVGTIYAWRYRGTGPRGIRVGKHIRFRRSDVDAWLERQADPR